MIQIIIILLWMLFASWVKYSDISKELVQRRRKQREYKIALRELLTSLNMEQEKVICKGNYYSNICKIIAEYESIDRDMITDYQKFMDI